MKPVKPITTLKVLNTRSGRASRGLPQNSFITNIKNVTNKIKNDPYIENNPITVPYPASKGPTTEPDEPSSKRRVNKAIPLVMIPVRTTIFTIFI